MDVYRNDKEKKISYVIFVVYLILLCWLILFKLAVTVDMIPHLRGVNLIPFYYDKGSPVHLREIIFNIIVFVPAGFYLTAMLYKKNIFLSILGIIGLSLLFEIIQYVYSIGASDITDLITNTIGGLCGMVLFGILGKVTTKYRMTIINFFGGGIEILVIVLVLITYV